ncbi:uncharacterized protein LAESUDRAFT_712235 [Laetiporus sulphureus 93-53]|uniref:Uncharacterized protein n=1 Tax=Laetiporus sulphureus 93-53 TaxID=1314785 RepID=A0A165G3X3_9APHY|nr:uncharacterized protein LAESUDRAFT_712235 [Laetiporus sulphureus 93-53]KZT09794.1 hypothetical protein LAESUDRAFT_712235 [Laetiporus sulphureus 93-53]
MTENAIRAGRAKSCTMVNVNEIVPHDDNEHLIVRCDWHAAIGFLDIIDTYLRSRRGVDQQKYALGKGAPFSKKVIWINLGVDRGYHGVVVTWVKEILNDAEDIRAIHLRNGAKRGGEAGRNTQAKTISDTDGNITEIIEAACCCKLLQPCIPAQRSDDGSHITAEVELEAQVDSLGRDEFAITALHEGSANWLQQHPPIQSPRQAWPHGKVLSAHERNKRALQQHQPPEEQVIDITCLVVGAHVKAGHTFLTNVGVEAGLPQRGHDSDSIMVLALDHDIEGDVRASSLSPVETADDKTEMGFKLVCEMNLPLPRIVCMNERKVAWASFVKAVSGSSSMGTSGKSCGDSLQGPRGTAVESAVARGAVDNSRKSEWQERPEGVKECMGSAEATASNGEDETNFGTRGAGAQEGERREGAKR